MLGICGGLQLLGREIHDPHRIESGDCPGLGLLDLTTTLVPDKTTRQRQVPWQGTLLCGYEIHHGQTQAGEEYRPTYPTAWGGARTMYMVCMSTGCLKTPPIANSF